MPIVQAASIAETGSAAAARLPLAGRRVLLIHPAWHSCGSHQVFVAQAQAYRALGAHLISLAVADFPGFVAGSKAHHAYLAATRDLVVDERFYAGMPAPRMARPAFASALIQWLRGNAAAMLIETAASAELPSAAIDPDRIDLIHCNHFFCMPVALALKSNRGLPILLDTHDVQARQFALRNEQRFCLPPKARYEDMLALECAAMQGADLLVHLNDEEAQSWQELLPGKRHTLIYPAIKPMPDRRTGSDLLIVASANYPNYLSLRWFLEKVRPLAPEVPVRIVGNIDSLVKAEAPALFAENAGLFCGRIDDLAAAYAAAALVLLPTISGHGLSIKTVEALSCGATLVATPEAFRGIAVDPASLANVALCTSAEAFAQSLRRLAQEAPTETQARRESATRQLYERLFSFAAYEAALAAAVAPLLKAPPRA